MGEVEDFDLLAGHDLGQSRIIKINEEEDPERLNVLVWNKLDTIGFQPAAREVNLSKMQSEVMNGIQNISLLIV